MTDIHFDLRIGGGIKPLVGAAVLTPTRVLYDESSVTMPEPQVLGLHDGKGIMQDVAPTPQGAAPSWAYMAEIIDGTTGKGKSWLVSVPDQDSIDFDDLSRPVTVVDPVIDVEAIAASVDGAIKSIYIDPETGDVTVTRVDGVTYPAGKALGAPGDKGDKGDDGAGIPSGGSAGQVPARTDSGGSAWVAPATLIPEATTAASGLMGAETLALSWAGLSLGTRDLNGVIIPGFYYQFTLDNVTFDRHYPFEAASCTVEVRAYAPGSTARLTQVLRAVANGRTLYRRTTDGGLTWSAWDENARLADADRAARAYAAPYDYRVTLEDTTGFTESSTDLLTITHTGDYVELNGTLTLKTAGHANGTTPKVIVKLPPDAYPTGAGIRWYQLRGGTGTKTVMLSVDAATNRVGLSEHTTGAVGDAIRIHASWAAKPRATTLWGQFFGIFHQGSEYQVITAPGSNPRLSTIALHGGAVEAGSEECARDLATRMGASMYVLDAMVETPRGQPAWSYMHLTSNSYDDPVVHSLVKATERCVSFHGANDSTAGAGLSVTFVGGRDLELRAAANARLRAAGFTTWDNPADFPALAGTSPANPCNQTSREGGLQLELSLTLRKSFFPNNDSSRTMRHSGQRTSTFTAYMDAIQQAVLDVMP